jgi:hypothetical protein
VDFEVPENAQSIFSAGRVVDVRSGLVGGRSNSSSSISSEDGIVSRDRRILISIYQPVEEVRTNVDVGSEAGSGSQRIEARWET